MHSRPFLALVLTLAAACSSSSSDPAGGSGGSDASSTSSSAGGAGGGPAIGADATVTAFAATPVFFTGWDPGQNARTVDVPVTFPAEGPLYATIDMDFALSCPAGGCDPWDRSGSLGIVRDAGTDHEEYIEISRFITPYGVGSTWSADVTDLRPLLTGDVVMRVFIDTWVGPGSPYGDGWQVDTSFRFKGGVPARRAIANIPVWTLRSAVYGDPLRTIGSQVTEAALDVPAGATALALRTFVTGHGQGNAENCAEFCSREHTLTIDGTAHTETIWRDDCAQTGAPGQMGTWKYARAGWCPGAITHPWTVELDAAPASGKVTVGYDVETYENTCRPDAAVCDGCTLGTDCPYDGGAHTEPNYQVSTLLIAYE